MNRERILAVIADFLEKRGKLPNNRNELLNYKYLEVGHIDSFGMVQLIMTIEDEFGIELQQENLEDVELVSTVRGLVDLVEMRIKQKR